MEMDETSKFFITLECLSARMGLPQKYLKELAGKERIPYLIVGGRLRFNQERVLRALNQIAESRCPNI